jgi:hypothetical protein
MPLTLLIGTAAGLASALLFVSIAAGSPLALVLCLLSPLPIMIAGLGWAHRNGLVAAVTASLVIAIGLGPLLGLAFALSTALPAWGLSYLALLGRREGSAVAEWFSPGQLVAVTSLAGAAVAIIGVLLVSASYDAYQAMMRQAIESLLRAVTGTPEGSPLAIPDVEDPAALVAAMAAILPLASAVGWVLSSLFNLWLAGRIVRTSGRLVRPWPDVPSLRLPRWAGLAAIIAFAIAWLPGLLGLFGRMSAAAMLSGFTVLGYAGLHDLTRGAAARPALLGALYVLSLVLNWVAVTAVTVFGVLDHFFDIRGRRKRPAND